MAESISALEWINGALEDNDYLKQVMASGEWEILYSKKNFVVIVDRINQRTAIFMRKIIPLYNKNFEVKGYDKTVEVQIIHERLTLSEAEQLYKQFKRKRGILINCAKSKHKVKLGYKAKKLTDEDRLRINRERQIYIKQKINELRAEYDKIKYKRKKEYKERKQKLKQLIKDYEKLLGDLQKTYKELLKELNKKDIQKEELLS
ncbi:MAG: hypothetical protein Q9M37_03480 [Desulfonauticus sp.]|nr:hypothetical protein [Desulfonauticus sp.]